MRVRPDDLISAPLPMRSGKRLLGDVPGRDFIYGVNKFPKMGRGLLIRVYILRRPSPGTREQSSAERSAEDGGCGAAAAAFCRERMWHGETWHDVG